MKAVSTKPGLRGGSGHGQGAHYYTQNIYFVTRLKVFKKIKYLILVGNIIKMILILYHEKLVNYNKYKIDIL